MNKVTQIIVDQAFYGEKNHSHGCLYSTVENEELKAFLTGFTDRPSSLPAGIIMQPYYSAILHGEYYIFTVTFPDTTAKRAGMVFTHALIVNTEDILYLNNLEILFEHFYDTIPEEKTSLQKLVFTSSSIEVNKTQIVFPKYILQCVTELTNGNLPLIFCGEPISFLKLIISIWAGLPQSFRTKIAYTAGFTTTNIDASKTVLYFQKNLEDSIRNIEFISDIKDEQSEPNSTIEKYILTPNTDNHFDMFLKELNIDLYNWSILQSCAKAYEGYQTYTVLSNDALKQLVRQLAKISPNKNNGRLIKDKVILEIKQRLDSGKETNLKSLKNLPLDKFASGEIILSSSVETFVNVEFSKKDHFTSGLISEVTILSYKETQPNWWHVAIKKALINTIKKENPTAIQNIWKLLIISEESLSATLSNFPEDRKYEQLLISHILRNIPQRIAKNFAQAIQKRKWVLLHAHLLQKYLTSKEAAKQQLSLEKNLRMDSFEGSSHIIKELRDTDLLSLTMETTEDFFIDEYVKRSLKNSTLLNELNIRNQTWLSIWAKTLKITNDLEYGILHLSEKIEQLLGYIIEGREITNEIIELVVKSRFADISELKNRPHLWKHLPAGVKDLFLDATANELVKSIYSKGLTGVIEPELINYISSDKYMTLLLRAYSSDINTVLVVYENISNLKDSFLADYIKFFPNNLNEVQSAHLGDLVLSKRFFLSARQIFEKAKYNHSFRIALTKCQSIAGLEFWDKFLWGRLFGETVSIDSVYSALVKIAVELYDKGPEDNDIWKKAGGKVSKLHDSKTREENWRTAINLLRNGGGGKDISVKSLLKEMLEDHPNNSELKEIKKYFKQNND